MANSPLEVKGLRKIVDKLSDEVVAAGAKALYARAFVMLDADYDVDKETVTSLGVTVKAAIPIDIPLDIGSSLGIHSTKERDSTGNLNIVFEISTHPPK